MNLQNMFKKLSRKNQKATKRIENVQRSFEI